MFNLFGLRMLLSKKERDLLDHIRASEELGKEADRIQAEMRVADPSSVSMTVKDGKMECEFSWDDCPAIQALGTECVKMFRETAAKNYIESLVFELKSKGSLDWYIFTIQKKGQKTPHQFRLEAEAKQRLAEDAIGPVSQELVRACDERDAMRNQFCQVVCFYHDSVISKHDPRCAFYKSGEKNA